MDISNRRRVIQSMFLLWSFIGLGWVIGQNGPSLIDLRMIINKDLDIASWLLTVMAIGYLVGSLVGGILYDRFNKVLMIALSAVVLSICTGLTPWCKWFPAMMATFFLSGFGCGWLDTGGNAYMISLWGGEGGSYMQALHFCFGIGAMISPIATEPFLAKSQCKSAPDNASLYIGGLHSNDSFDNTTHISTCVSSYESTNIRFAYLITFVIVLSSSVPFFYMYTTWAERDNHVTSKDSSCLQNHYCLPDLQKRVAITFLFFILLTYRAVEETHFGYLATFCISYLHWSSNTSSYATSLFWITYSAGRLLGIFLIKTIKPVQLLFFFLSLLVLSYVGFLISSTSHLTTLNWLFIALTGFSMSVVFPGVLTWTHENVTEVSGKLSSIFHVAASCGQMMNLFYLGYLMDNISPMWFVYILLGESCLCLILFLIVYNYTMKSVASMKRLEKGSVIEITLM